MARRPWYATLVVVPKTALRTAQTFGNERLEALRPAFLMLLMLSALLWVISTIAPLAPFVYSLF
jgi:hypothetical protein